MLRTMDDIVLTNLVVSGTLSLVDGPACFEEGSASVAEGACVTIDDSLVHWAFGSEEPEPELEAGCGKGSQMRTERATLLPLREDDNGDG